MARGPDDRLGQRGSRATENAVKPGGPSSVRNPSPSASLAPGGRLFSAVLGAEGNPSVPRTGLREGVILPSSGWSNLLYFSFFL